MPEGYVNFGPWLSAHQKTCPGERVPKLVARMRRVKEKGVRTTVKNDPVLQTQEFLTEMGAKLGARLIHEAIGTFFHGKVKP